MAAQLGEPGLSVSEEADLWIKGVKRALSQEFIYKLCDLFDPHLYL